LDLCHVDQAGFAPTMPTSYSWSAIGQRLTVPYEAPQGRRVNAIGGYFSHGPLAGSFSFVTFASLPRSRAKQVRKSEAERAADHGLAPEEVGAIDSEVFLGFLWTLAGRPPDAAGDWRRERPLTVVIDNYSVHKSTQVREEAARLAAADIHLFYLPAYSPELSRIEPIWQDAKYREMPVRSHAQLGDLKRAVDEALARKAVQLRQTTQLLNRPA
jgi:hypothetical protein